MIIFLIRILELDVLMRFAVLARTYLVSINFVALVGVGCTLDATVSSTLPVMSLQKVTPETISFSGNTYIEISGDGFTEKTVAFIDDKPCTELTLLSSAKIKCKAPASLLTDTSESAYVDVRVTNGIQTLNFKSVLKYRSDAVYEVKKFSGALSNSGHLDAVGTQSRFISPTKPLSVGDHVYVSDTATHTIRRFSKVTGDLETFVGKPLISGFADGVGTNATLSFPMGLAYHDGYIYVADNGSCTIRRIHLQSQVVERFAGVVQDSVKDGCGTPDEGTVVNGLDAVLSEVTSLATDGQYLYLGDASREVRKISLTGTRTVSLLTAVNDVYDYIVDVTYSGNYLYYMGYSTSGVESAIGRISTVSGVNEDLVTGITSRVGGIDVKNDTLYVSSATTNTIRKMDLTQTPPLTLQNFFGSGIEGQLDGDSGTAKLFHPAGMHIDGDILYFTSYGARNLRRINLNTMSVVTLSGAAE